MVVEAVAALAFAVCVLLGVHRGTRDSVGRVLRFVGCNLAAALATFYGGDALRVALGVTPFLAAPLAGLLGFFATWIVLSLFLRSAGRSDRERIERAGGRSLVDRLGGGLVGVAQGALLVVLVGWLGGAFMDTVRFAARSDGSALRGEPLASPLVDASQRVIEQTIEGIADDETVGRVTAHWIARPGVSFEALDAVLTNPRINELERDATFWKALDAGHVDAALASPALRRLAHDAPLRRELARLGAVPEATTHDPAAFERALRETIERIAPLVRGLSRDPDLQALLADPTVQDALGRGQPWRLLAHPRLRHLASRLGAQG